MKLLAFTTFFLVVFDGAYTSPPVNHAISSTIRKGSNYERQSDHPTRVSRQRRYLGLSKRYKLNKRYQECIAPGDVQGHCKHAVYCQADVTSSSKNVLDYLCVIAKTHIGVCCPDDILLSNLKGSSVIADLPASGTDYDEDDRNTGCGLASMSTHIGETPTGQKPSKRWPWIAALYKDGMEEQFCGGALISEQHILTAAHCFVGVQQGVVRVRLGEYDFLRRNETRSKDFTVASMVIHEEFNGATFENDIAILKLDRPTTFNTYIWPICLPPRNESFENETVTVAGWGQIFFGGPTSEKLLEINIPVWPQEMCVGAFAQRITESNMCAAGYDGDLDSCKGDSGGPLLYQLPENGRWVAAGVVSWGIGCGMKKQPGVYTRVNHFLPWIITNAMAK